MQDHPFKGLLFMSVAVFLIATMNVFAKILSDYLDIIEIVFYRNAVGLVFITLLIFALRQENLFRTKRWKAQSIRAVAGTIGVALMFWSYSLMPMAEVTAIMFTGGIMNLILSSIILKENVNVYRWGAVVFGIVGGLIVILPDGTAVTMEGSIVALIAAFVGGAVISIVLRSLGQSEHSYTTVFYFSLIGTVITLPYVLIKSTSIDFDMMMFLLSCGFVGFLSLLVKTYAYCLAESSLLSPIYYAGIIWTTFFGWMIWEDWPTINVFIGAGIIISSNLFILWREHRRSKINENPRA